MSKAIIKVTSRARLTHGENRWKGSVRWVVVLDADGISHAAVSAELLDNEDLVASVLRAVESSPLLENEKVLLRVRAQDHSRFAGLHGVRCRARSRRGMERQGDSLRDHRLCVVQLL